MFLNGRTEVERGESHPKTARRVPVQTRQVRTRAGAAGAARGLGEDDHLRRVGMSGSVRNGALPWQHKT